MAGQALEGLRVADFSWYIAGPSITMWLAHHGAEVIRIESMTRPDEIRGIEPFKDGTPGIKYASDIRTGAFAETIVQVAGERRCTRIVMGTRGLGAVSGVVLGSVTYGVVHLAAMPVTLVK